MTTPAPEPAPAAKPRRRWWLRMIVASAALVAVLLGVVWLVPAARLGYYAWQYRRHYYTRHLETASAMLVERQASRQTVEAVLGEAGDSCQLSDGTIVWLYGASDDRLMGSYVPVLLYFKKGHVREAETGASAKAANKFDIRAPN